MNKQAAEKIAQEYYQIGQVLALESNGMTKEAKNLRSELLKRLGLTGAGVIGLRTAMNPEGMKALAGTIGENVGGKADDLLVSLLGKMGM
tara:strand:+ start:105 stop:374 length:270 start_codon:yes stop_codon:yes gene_type:complete